MNKNGPNECCDQEKVEECSGGIVISGEVLIPFAFNPVPPTIQFLTESEWQKYAIQVYTILLPITFGEFPDPARSQKSFGVIRVIPCDPTSPLLYHIQQTLFFDLKPLPVLSGTYIFL